MADFFTTTSVVDKATAAAAAQLEEQNVQATSEAVKNMNEATKESGKGSNFSMCEIIM